MRNHYIKRIFAAVTAACVGISAVPAVSAADEAGDGGMAMGRYLESEVTLPESDGGWLVYDLVRKEDGTLRMIAKCLEDDSIRLWDSSDLGESWQLAFALPEELGELYFSDMTLCADGGGAGNGIDMTDMEDLDYRYVPFDAEGNAENIAFPDETANFYSYTRDGKLVGMTYGGAAFSMDRDTGAVRNEFVSSGVERIAVCGKEVLLLMDGQVQCYDIDSGEPSGREEALGNALFAGNRSYMDSISFGHSIVFTEDEEGRLYYCTNDGIFSHSMWGSTVEQVVDGMLCSLSSPSIAPLSMEVIQGSFLVTYLGEQGTSKILRYSYDPNAASLPQKEITIYSLREDTGLRQVITAFRKQYPDTYVNYETGMSGGDGVTVSDALRTLNTDILAGNGPDVLVLDGMSVETYAAQGLLMDLSDILEEVETEDGLLEKIAYTWQNESGVPAVPGRFGISLAAGSAEYLNRLEDAAALEELAGEAGVLDWSVLAQLPEILYYTSACGWKNEDGTINAEKLADYVQAVKRIYDTCMENETEKFRGNVQMFSQEIWEFYQEELLCYGDLTGAWWDLLSGEAKLFVGILSNMMGYGILTSTERETGDCEVKLFGAAGQKAFLPVCNVGILSNGRDTESAEQFVRFFLSKDGAVQTDYEGFPVNRAALWEAVYTDRFGVSGISFSSGDAETGEVMDFVCLWPEKEQLDWLMQAAESLEVRIDTEQVQMDTVTEETRRCLTGEISEEEAVNSILQKINLYLAEL